MQAAPVTASALTSPAKLLSEIFGKNEINNGFIVVTKKAGEKMTNRPIILARPP